MLSLIMLSVIMVSEILLCDIVLNNAVLSIVATPSGAPYGIPQTANVRLGLKQFSNVKHSRKFNWNLIEEEYFKY
jgi:hypothetical protein